MRSTTISHKTLRITRGMAAGLSDHVWSLEEIVASGELRVCSSVRDLEGEIEKARANGPIFLR